MYLQTMNMLQSIIWKEEQISLQGLKKDLNATEENYKIYKKDIKYDFKKKNTAFDTELMFDLFEKIYNNFSIICKIEKTLHIDESNKEYLQKLFNKEIPKQKEIKFDNMDIIYNYHLKSILTKLALVEEMLNYKPIIDVEIEKK